MRESRPDSLHARLGRDLESSCHARASGRRGKNYACRCGRPIFFGNTLCLACRSPLGYASETGEMHALDPAPISGTWTYVHADGGAVDARRCANLDTPAGCNWLVPAYEPERLCLACRLNRTIPNLDDGDNRRYWGLIEAAKRRLVAQLVALDLPVASKLGADRERGLAFDFLRGEGGKRVVTGHADGIITINAEEADDAKREKARLALHEPYRTLLGHLRHEVGHYYWDRLVEDARWHEPYRALLGDERVDYAAALKANYDQGPPADGATATSAAMRRAIGGRTGPRPGRITCTSSTGSTRRSGSASRRSTSTRRSSASAATISTRPTTRRPTGSSSSSTRGSSSPMC